MLKINNIDVYYNQVRALNNVNIEVKEGETVAIIGANGAGKTTLLRTISSLIKPKKGEVLLDGVPIHGMPPEDIVGKGIIHVPEGRGIFPLSTTWNNLLVGAYSRKDKHQVNQDAERYLKLFPILEERKNELAKMLSGGEQQMLAICRALMAKPRLLLLDEPSLGLSPLATKEIFNIIKKLRSEKVSIVLVEQNATQALKIADRAYVLVTGEVAMEGPCEELLTNDEIRKLYLGGI